MRFTKPKKGGVKLPTLNNPASAENVQSGFEVIGADGNKITGTHEEEPGLDTSDATATAADIDNGKTAYGATGKVTGTGKVLDYLIIGVSKTVLYDGLEVPTPSRANIVRGGGVSSITYDAAFVNDSELHFRNKENIYFRDLNISNTSVRVAPIYLDRDLSFYYVIGKDKTL